MAASSISSSAREVLLRQLAGHRLVDEVDDLRLQRRLAERGRRMLRLVLDQAERLADAMTETLRGVAPLDHAQTQRLDGGRVGGVEKGHRRRGAGIELLLALAPQQVAHGDRDVAEVDVDRARVEALVAHRAVVGHVGEFVEMLERDAAPRLLLVKEGLDQQRGGEDLVARRVEQVGTRHMGAAHRLALAAAQAVLDRLRNTADVALLHDQRLGAEQRERRRVGARQIGAGQQLALVEAALRIDALLVIDEGCDLRLARGIRSW